jgi:hypothetical protein
VPARYALQSEYAFHAGLITDGKVAKGYYDRIVNIKTKGWGWDHVFPKIDKN